MIHQRASCVAYTRIWISNAWCMRKNNKLKISIIFLCRHIGCFPCTILINATKKNQNNIYILLFNIIWHKSYMNTEHSRYISNEHMRSLWIFAFGVDSSRSVCSATSPHFHNFHIHSVVQQSGHSVMWKQRCNAFNMLWHTIFYFVIREYLFLERINSYFVYS